MSRELQTINQQNKLALWARRIKACRSSGHNVKEWCKENSIFEQTYYRWQKKLFEIAKAQQGVCFAEVTPAQVTHTHNVAVTVRLSGADRVYIACGYTDLRCGIDGLASLVQQQF